MSDFKIIPVIDILNSKAVHAKKGERNKYRPLESPLLNTTDPVLIVKKLSSLGFKCIYLADLDAITKKNPNITLLEEITSISDVSIYLDPGIRSEKEINTYLDIRINKLIIGLETVYNLDVISNCFSFLPKNKIIISVDMYRKKIISNCKSLNNLDPIEVIEKLNNVGVFEIILLDLFRVGQKMDGIPKLYEKIKKTFTGKVLVGGGIKNLNDIKTYQKANYAGVLIGTALYDGTIDHEDLIL
jgi:phosphoribosylformimino-5-aminoimidazole carboxamide ribotide isomerase